MVDIGRYIDAQGILRNAANAVVDERKLTEYALNMDSEKGRDKAYVFARILGFTPDNAEDLRRQILAGIGKYQASLGDKDDYGQRFMVFMPVMGPKGTAFVKTGWIQDMNDDLRLTTVMVADPKEQEACQYLMEDY